MRNKRPKVVPEVRQIIRLYRISTVTSILDSEITGNAALKSISVSAFQQNTGYTKLHGSCQENSGVAVYIAPGNNREKRVTSTCQTSLLVIVKIWKTLHWQTYQKL